MIKAGNTGLFFVMWEFEFGYIGLFLSAFLAATILPIASEVFLLAMLKLGFDPFLCLILATIGNSLGAILNYFIGYIGNPSWLNKIGVKLEQIERWKQRVQTYGVWLALLSWLPVVGDLIGVALGFFRAPKGTTFVFFTIGKFLRYSAIILLYFLF
jgi:membrane protein YqaA with SNARE-associated domain